MSAELSGSTALVTGATAGIGRAVAVQLAGLGAEVVVHGRDSQRGADTVAEIEAAGGTARFASAIVFLSGPRASYVSGAVLQVHGGLQAVAPR